MSALEKLVCFTRQGCVRLFASGESGPEQKEYTEEEDDYGVFKTCPFLPSPGQYLPSRHTDKQTFFSGLNGLVSQACPVPSTEVGV